MEDRYQFDDEGNAVNPPVIPQYEQALAEAQARGDADDIEDITAEYHEARNAKAQRHNDRLDKAQADSDDPDGDGDPYEGLTNAQLRDRLDDPPQDGDGSGSNGRVVRADLIAALREQEGDE